MDDIDGQCGKGSYPLLRAVSNVFESNRIQLKTIENISSENKTIFCSISSFAEQISTKVRFDLSRINPYLCTHLLVEKNSSFSSPMQYRTLKNFNRNLQILLTIYFNENIDLNQLKNELDLEQINGINIQLNSNTYTQNFSELIQNIHKILKPHHLLTISFQLPTDPTQQASFFDMIELHKIVDYLLVLPFEGQSIERFRELQPWNSLASFVQADTKKNIGDFSMVSILMFLLSAGVPKDKLILSIPTFGLTYTLESPEQYRIGDMIASKGLPGPSTQTPGILSKSEVRD